MMTEKVLYFILSADLQTKPVVTAVDPDATDVSGEDTEKEDEGVLPNPSKNKTKTKSKSKGKPTRKSKSTSKSKSKSKPTVILADTDATDEDTDKEHEMNVPIPLKTKVETAPNTKTKFQATVATDEDTDKEDGSNVSISLRTRSKTAPKMETKYKATFTTDDSDATDEDKGGNVPIPLQKKAKTVSKTKTDHKATVTTADPDATDEDEEGDLSGITLTSEDQSNTNPKPFTPPFTRAKGGELRLQMAKAAASKIPAPTRQAGSSKRVRLEGPSRPGPEKVRGHNPKHALMMEDFDLNYNITKAEREIREWRKRAAEVQLQLNKLRKEEDSKK
jgi:hypothetical protein